MDRGTFTFTNDSIETSSQISSRMATFNNDQTITKKNETCASNISEDCVNVLDEVKEKYNKNLMASTAELEEQYIKIIKDLKQRYKSDKQKYKYEANNKIKTLNQALKENEQAMNKTKSLERELQASKTVMKTINEKLDKANYDLDKKSSSSKNLETTVKNLKMDLNCVEKELHEQRKLSNIDNNKIKSLEYSLKDYKSINENLQQKLNDLTAEHELQNEQNKAEFSVQFTEMTEDMAILCGRVQEMSTVKQELENLQEKYDSTCAINTEVTEKNGALIEEIKAFGEKLEESLGKYENCVKEISLLKNNLKEVNNQKWILETTNSRLDSNLKEARCEQLELTKKLEKKEKMYVKINQQLVTAEQSIIDSKEECHKLNSDLKNSRNELAKMDDIKNKMDSLINDNTLMQNDLINIKDENSQLRRQNVDIKLQYEHIINNHESSMEQLSEKYEKQKQEALILMDRFKNSQNHLEGSEVNICEMRLKYQQLEHERDNSNAQKRKLESELSETICDKEKVEHNLIRQQRKYDFLKDELDQVVGQRGKERNKIEKLSSENLSLTDQNYNLKATIDKLNLQLNEAENKTTKTMGKSERMKEKIKAYHKNLAVAHVEEVSDLQSKIKNLEKKLHEQESAWRNKHQINVQESLKGRGGKSKLGYGDKKKIKELETYIKNLSDQTFNDKQILDRLDTQVKTLQAEKIKLTQMVENNEIFGEQKNSTPKVDDSICKSSSSFDKVKSNLNTCEISKVKRTSETSTNKYSGTSSPSCSTKSIKEPSLKKQKVDQDKSILKPEEKIDDSEKQIKESTKKPSKKKTLSPKSHVEEILAKHGVGLNGKKKRQPLAEKSANQANISKNEKVDSKKKNDNLKKSNLRSTRVTRQRVNKTVCV